MQCASKAAHHPSALLRARSSSSSSIDGGRSMRNVSIHPSVLGSERAPLDSTGWGAFQKSSLVQIWLILCGSLTGGWKEPMAFLAFGCHRPHKLGQLPRPPSHFSWTPPLSTDRSYASSPRRGNFKRGAARPARDGCPPPTMFHHLGSLTREGWTHGWPMDGTHSSFVTLLVHLFMRSVIRIVTLVT